MMETGIRGSQSVKVEVSNTARAMGSGTMDVFATPAMIALMEKTAWMSVAAELEAGQGTVGISLEITHDAPSPLGMTVTCESELTEMDGRRLVFAVEAKDETGAVIGKGRHERFIVWEEKFQAKADSLVAGD